MSGLKSRQKGVRVERDVVNWHRDTGVYAERVPLSGASHYQGSNTDIDVYAFGRNADPLRFEIKARKDGAGFRLFHKWLEGKEGLITKQNGTQEVVHLPRDTYERMLRHIADLEQRLESLIK